MQLSITAELTERAAQALERVLLLEDSMVMSEVFIAIADLADGSENMKGEER